MKTRSGWFHLRRLLLLSGGCALGVMLSASAFAGPTIDRTSTSAARPHTAQDMPTQKKVLYYVMTSASAIPKPINYVIGGLMTTAVPIQIIGRGQTVVR